ncbi:MAG TPA: PKD domain-containing protein, partial [Verrucomicrobiae bacterium]|nr:PKD domain-containing protein [Verrucomicrobiae bacterium]
ENGMTPGDFATIYNVKPLYSAGINGAGVVIGLCEETHVAVTDIHNFRSRFKLPTNDPVFVFNGPDPGISQDDGEADPDTEWAGAVAKNATVKFCVADNVDLSAQYLVDNNLADIISTSFGDCEQTMGASGDQFYKNLWAQASAQGITVFAAAGDSGAAECDAGGEGGGIGQGALGTASTVYNIAVGGTEFNEGTNNSLYWNSTTNADGSSAKGYIPEVVWNESSLVPGGRDIWAGAGGPSALYTKPAWQAAPGMPRDGWRDTPDISLAAAGFHDGYIIVSGGALQTIGGTSLSSPAYASIMALIVQKTGQRQGNCDPNFYRLARNQYLNLGPVIFHDITVGNNNVRNTAGYNAAPGYDMASGLGSVDVTALVNNWGASTNVSATITAPDVDPAVLNGTTLSFSGSATDNVPQHLNYVWRLGDGSVATGTNVTHMFSNPGVKNLGQTVTVTATDGSGDYGSFSRNVTVGADLYAPRQLLLNTSFEAQDLNWIFNGFLTAPFAAIGEPAHSGVNTALANSSDTITMYQQVAIPSTYNQATLSFWLHVDTLSTSTTAQDTLKVQIRNSSGTVLKTLATYSNRTTNKGYAQKTFDVSAYCGQTIQVYFTATETADAQTSFAIDDVTLNARVIPVHLEAENLPRISSGAATQNIFETNASGGEWVSFLADNVGDSVDYLLTNVPAGTYDFNFIYKAHPNRGMMSMALDGDFSDGILDQYSPVPIFQVAADYGLVTFNTNGNHVVHMVVTGKNTASTNYN